MSNERNLISDQVITNRAPVRNQDNKHAKKASDGTMSFMVWSITGTALAACSGPIFGDGTSIGGGGGRSGGNGGIPAPENGASAPIGDTQFGSVPEAGGVYIRPEVLNDDGTAQGAEIMFRPATGDADGSDDARLIAAAGQLGTPDTPTGANPLTDFAATLPVGSATFYFVSEANLERLVLNPDNNYEGAERNFQIRFLAYDGVDGTFTRDIAGVALADTSTLNVVFEDFDDLATDITLGSNPMNSLPEDTSAALRATRTEIATLDLTGDPDGGESGTLEIVEVAGTDHEMFEIEGNVLYLSAGTNLDFETSPTLNVRVGLEGTTVVENVVVTVTNVEGEPGDFDDYATGIELASSPTPVRTLPEDPDTEPARGTRIDIATLVLTGDPDGGNSGTLQRAGTHAAMFDLDGNVLYLRADAALDFETLSTLDISVRLMEVPSVSVDVDVTVTDVVEGIPAREDGANAPIMPERFGSLSGDGGIYIKAEVENEAGDVQAAQIMFRPATGDADGSDDITLAMALADGNNVLGVPVAAPANPPGFAASVTVDTDNIFYFVSRANLERLVLNPNEALDVSGTFQIRYLEYDGLATTFTNDIAGATLASASTVPVAFEAVDDPVTAIVIEDGTTPVSELAENVGGTVTTRTKIADLAFTDNDDTPSDALEIVVTDGTLDSAVVASIIALFEIADDELYLVDGERLDFETVPALPIRVQSVADSTIGVNIPVAVTDEVEVNIPPILGIADGEQSIANIVVNDGSQTATTVISFGDDDDGDPNDGLTIRGDASHSSTAVPDTPVYADAGADLTFVAGLARIVGEYGTFIIARNDDNGRLSVTYELDTTDTDVSGLVTGAELFEKLTVYVHDGDDPSAAQDFVVRIEGPAANSVPTATGDGTATVANDEAGTIETTISFGDTDSENDDLAIRAVASGGADVPATPMYDSNVPLIVHGTDAMVAGEYGMFTISRSNADDELTVTYDLTEGHDDVTGAGDDLFEKLTVYVHDGDDPSAAQDFVVTINKPSPVQNGFYHLPAMGEIPVVEGATSYSITTSNNAVPGLASDRVTEETSGLFFRVEIKEDAGGGAWTWSAIPTEALRIFNSATDTTDREFWVHAHSGAGDGDNLMEVGQRIEVLFNRVDIIAEANPDVTSSHYRAIPTDGISNAGTGENELFIGTEPDTVAGTTGDDVFRNTGGGTDVIFARGGDDTFNLGRNHSDVIYHRFSSSGTDWTNTDGGDTISNYVRSGANVANDTFIFVDTDTTDVAIKDDFMGNNNIRFYATLTGTDADLKISQFEIRFVDPDNRGTVESTITIIYNTDLQPTIGTDQAERTAFGLPDEDTVMAGIQVTAGEKEITNGTTWGHYFGETPDAFRVIDDSELPTAITNIADAVDMI